MSEPHGTQAQAPKKKSGVKKKLDPEVSAMNAVTAIFAGLDGAARCRVHDYIGRRFVYREQLADLSPAAADPRDACHAQGI